MKTIGSVLTISVVWALVVLCTTAIESDVDVLEGASHLPLRPSKLSMSADHGSTTLTPDAPRQSLHGSQLAMATLLDSLYSSGMRHMAKLAQLAQSEAQHDIEAALKVGHLQLSGVCG